jgi:hypothetical protein
MEGARSIPIVCNVLSATDRQEKDRLWAELRNAFIGIESQHDGFQLRFRAPRVVLESFGKLIALERECCRFLHIRLDVPPSKADDDETLSLSLSGGKGTKEFLASALASIGLPIPAARRSSKWVTLGLSGVSFGVICCVLPPVLLALGMGGVAGWFAALDSTAGVIIGGSAGAMAYGLHKSRNRKDRCSSGC